MEAIVQSLIGDSLLPQVTRGILVTVQTQLGRVGKIGTELFRKKGPKSRSTQYQVIVVDHGGGAN
jgi:hypothetical protein